MGIELERAGWVCTSTSPIGGPVRSASQSTAICLLLALTDLLLSQAAFELHRRLLQDVRMILLLASLPGEVLAQILSGPASHSVITLWKTGDSAMQAKLASSITGVELKAVRHSRASFPRLFCQFKSLRYLYIRSHHDLMKKTIDWPSLITSLPPTLETLRITSPDSNSALLRANARRSPSSGHCLVDIERLFPRLHTLALKSRAARSTPILEVADFSGLPSTLTSLDSSFQHNYSSYESRSFMSLLPRGLKFLKGNLQLAVSIQARPHLATDWANAPPHLEALPYISRSYSPNTTQLELERHLPKTLTECHWVPAEWSAEIARSWPPLVSSLTLCSVDESISPVEGIGLDLMLPRSLQDLILYRVGGWLNIPLPLTNLPSSLTSFISYFDLDWNLADREGMLPASLTTLHLFSSRLSALWRPEPMLQVLSKSSLTSLVLQIELEDEQDFHIDLQTLPSGLTSLQVESISSPAIVFSSGKLPPALQNLIILTPFRVATPSEPTQSPSSSTAPPLLDWHNLKHLTLKKWEIDPQLAFSSLPRSLIFLQIMDLHIPQEAPVVARRELFHSLPPRLTSLNLSPVEPLPVPHQKDLSTFAPDLRALTFDRWGKMPSSFLRDVPTHLRTFIVELDSIEAEDAPFIPPHLKSFFIGYQCRIEADVLVEHWPLKAELQRERQRAMETKLEARVKRLGF